MSFADRLNEAMLEKGFTQASLGRAVNMAQSSVWKLTSGKAKKTRKILDIASTLGVNPIWLEKGIGDKYLPVNQKILEFHEWDDSIALDNDEVEVIFYKSIELAAGQGNIVEERNENRKLRFSKSFFKRKGVFAEHVVCCLISGDSMEPIIPGGSTVAIDTLNKNIVDGDIYAICQDDLCRIKRLYRLPNGKVRINSYNSKYNPDELAEMSTMKIIGKVFYYSVEL